MLSVASNLAQLREFRDLFEDVNDRIVEPLIEAGLDARSWVLLRGLHRHIALRKFVCVVLLGKYICPFCWVGLNE